MFAHSAVHGHEVLQKVLVTEPETLLPLLTTEQERPLQFITAFLLPYLEREQRPAASSPASTSASGRLRGPHDPLAHRRRHGDWDLDDPAEVTTLVRNQLLAGVLTPCRRSSLTLARRPQLVSAGDPDRAPVGTRPM